MYLLKHTSSLDYHVKGLIDEDSHKECAPGVDVLHEVEPLEVCVLGGSQTDSAGVVHQDVDAAKLLHSLLDSIDHLGFVPHVHDARQAPPSGRFHCMEGPGLDKNVVN